MDNVTDVEDWTQWVMITVVATAEVALILTVQDVGALNTEPGEVDLIFDQDSEVLCLLQHCSGVSERKKIVFHRTPGINITCSCG